MIGQASLRDYGLNFQVDALLTRITVNLTSLLLHLADYLAVIPLDFLQGKRAFRYTARRSYDMTDKIYQQERTISPHGEVFQSARRATKFCKHPPFTTKVHRPRGLKSTVALIMLEKMPCA